MRANARFLRVYFLDEPRPPTRRGRLARFLIQKASGGRFHHIAVADAEVVVNPAMGGVVFHNRDAFESRTRAHAVYVDIPCRYGVDLGFFECRVRKRIPWVWTWLRWLTRGRFPRTTWDCLCCAMRCLDAAGVDPPAKPITTPAALLRWLTETKGFACRTLPPNARAAARPSTAEPRPAAAST